MTHSQTHNIWLFWCLFSLPMSVEKIETDQIFAMFADENGKMPAESVTRSMRCAGIVADGNYLGEAVDLPTYRELIGEARSTEIPREQIEAAFKLFDPQDTGYIKAADLREILTGVSSPFLPADIRDLFDKFPPNDEGLVCYNLFFHEFYGKSEK